MFNKINLKVLTGIFTALMVLSLVIIFVNRGEGEASRNRSFKSQIIQIDTSKVTAITIEPRGGSEKIQLKKEKDSWKVSADGKDYNADFSAVRNVLAMLGSMKATHVAATSKDMWDKFEVTDSAATHVMVREGKKLTADIYLGRFSYQAPRNQNPYMTQQQGKMTSYIRAGKDKRVYAVDGMVAITLNRQANDFRNRTIVRSEKEEWDLISIVLPGETYEMVRQNGRWTLSGNVADSAVVESYLSSLARLSSSNFIDESALTGNSPVMVLTIEGENISPPIKIEAYPADSINKFAIASSLNPGTYFSGEAGDLAGRTFKGKSYFLTSVNIP